MAELLSTGYGKEAVSVYRTDGVSSLFACEIGMRARGAVFDTSYTEGDNTQVVATDSMKNFIHITALEYAEESLEGFLELLVRTSRIHRLVLASVAHEQDPIVRLEACQERVHLLGTGEA